jgi:hypothetical protein
VATSQVGQRSSTPSSSTSHNASSSTARDTARCSPRTPPWCVFLHCQCSTSAATRSRAQSHFPPALARSSSWTFRATC